MFRRSSRVGQIAGGINPTATLYLTLSLTSLSVREIRAMIAPLDPGHVGKDLLNRRRAQG